MAKEKEKCLVGISAAASSDLGHINKKEAKEISGPANYRLGDTYDKASHRADSVMRRKGERMDKYLDRLAEQIYKYFKHYGRKFLK